MAKIIDGKEVSAQVKEQVKEEAAQLKAATGLQVGLAVVIVGNNPASRVYVNNKKKHARRLASSPLSTHWMRVPHRRSCWNWWRY